MTDISDSNQDTTLQKALHQHPSTKYSPHQTRVQRGFIRPVTSSDRSAVLSHKLLLSKYFSYLVEYVACCVYRIAHFNLRILLVKQIHLENRFCVTDSKGSRGTGEKISRIISQENGVSCETGSHSLR